MFVDFSLDYPSQTQWNSYSCLFSLSTLFFYPFIGFSCPIFCQGNVLDFSSGSVFREAQAQAQAQAQAHDITKDQEAQENSSAYRPTAHFFLFVFVCLFRTH